MSALALHMHNCGAIVSGSDITSSKLTQLLASKGIKISIGHAAKNIDAAELVVINAAIAEDNPELLAAKEKKRLIILREQLLGELFNNYPNSIAVSGSHGKTSVTALISFVLKELGQKPTAFVGGVAQQLGGNYLYGENDYCVAEACEYKRSFLQLIPRIAVVLNIEMDHADYYSSLNDLKDAFCTFVGNARECVVACGDSVPQEILDCNHAQVLTYGFSPVNRLVAANIAEQEGKYSADVLMDGVQIGRLNLEIFGRVNLLNALAAYSAVRCCTRAGDEDIFKAINKFCGVGRRFEKIPCSFTTLISDYAHHPTEIKNLIATAKKVCKGRVLGIFQPHTYSRTRSLMDEFSVCFDGLDLLVLLPVYAAREKSIAEGESQALAHAVKNVNVVCVDTQQEAVEIAKSQCFEGDMVLLIGAGDIDEIRNLIN